jgi:hypothetical protein
MTPPARTQRGRVESRSVIKRVAICGVCGREQALSTRLQPSDIEQLARLHWWLSPARGWVCSDCVAEAAVGE